VTPHLEYIFPVLANISDNDLESLERVKVQCIRRMTGAKAHSSSAALEVVSGILPVRLHK